MAVPVLVQAGAGNTITTGSGTTSITGCTAGNLVMFHFVTDGTAFDLSNGAHTNWENLAGTPSAHSTIVNAAAVGATAAHSLYLGRVTADGTVSQAQTVGASGEDIFARFYEFSGVSKGTTVATVCENTYVTNVGGIYTDVSGTSTSIANAPVKTTVADGLALNFVSVNANQAVSAFTGMTGGTWAEVVAEYVAGGTVATMQLQSASMPSPATIDGGSLTITSAAWGVLGLSLIPSTALQVPAEFPARHFGPF